MAAVDDISNITQMANKIKQSIDEQLKDKMEWQDMSVYTEFCTALEGGKQMEKPSEYITVLK